MHVWYPLRPGESTETHGTEVTDGCEHHVDLGIESASSRRVAKALNQ